MEDMLCDTVTIYVVTDDGLKAMSHQESDDCQMTDAEVLTTAFVSALYFGGNLQKARSFLKSTGLIPTMLSKSRLNRRLHALADTMLRLFHQLGMALKANGAAQVNDDWELYLVDSFPVAICDNIRIRRCRLVRNEDVDPEDYRGYIASKRRYFYGVRVHVVTTASGIPVEMAFLPGEAHDVRGFDVLPLVLPEGSEVYADKAYNDYGAEDAMRQMDQVSFDPIRKTNSTRWESEPSARHRKRWLRKRVETVFSQITACFPKSIHAVTLKAFMLKVATFIFAFTIKQAFM